jgi:hypothetical protein
MNYKTTLFNAFPMYPLENQIFTKYIEISLVSIRKSPVQNQLLKQPSIVKQLVVICGLGLLLGITSIWIPPYLILIGVAGIIYLVVAWLWPEIAILGVLIFTSTTFDIYAYPSIPIGIGNLIISDLLLFALLGIVIIRGLIKSSSFFRHTPLDLPLLAFYGTALLATLVGIYFARVTFNGSLGELRVINFYLAFFIVTNLVRNGNQIRRLYNGIILLAIFVSISMILQYALGDTIQILPGRVETLSTAGTTSYGITRVLPPGQSLVAIIFVCLVIQVLFDQTYSRFILNLIQLGTVGLAVLLTFNRSFWAAILFALLLVSLLVSLRDRIRFFNLTVWVILVGTLILVPVLTINQQWSEKFIDGLTVRMSTLFNPDTAKEESLLYRYVENEYAYPQIAAHPLLGLGLGADYRPFDRRIRSTEPGYIHNGHLWMMLKIGIVGYFFFMWALLLFIKRSLQSWKYISDLPQKGMLLAFGVMIFGMLLISILNPIFRNWYWSPITGVMLGMGEVIIKLNTNQTIN